MLLTARIKAATGDRVGKLDGGQVVGVPVVGRREGAMTGRSVGSTAILGANVLDANVGDSVLLLILPDGSKVVEVVVGVSVGVVATIVGLGEIGTAVSVSLEMEPSSSSSSSNLLLVVGSNEGSFVADGAAVGETICTKAEGAWEEGDNDIIGPPVGADEGAVV
jgi:hypothetical protein